jgi:diguanylate cyclase (GGDEF)-like protein
MALLSEQKSSAISRMGEQSLAIRLMEHLIVPTFVIGADGKVLIWNKACERLTHLSAADVLDTATHWRAFYTEQRPCLADLVAAGRFAEIETFYHGWSSFGLTDFGVSIEAHAPMPLAGRPMSLAVDAGPIYDESGSLLAVIETFRDITAQKEAQSLLETLAARDGLTDLLNRRSFDHAVSAEMRRCARDGQPLSLLMIDIDHFKRFNDEHGHDAGDAVLRAVGHALRHAVRGGDLVFRFGGEELLILLPDTGAEAAAARAEEVRGLIESLAVAHDGRELGPVTASIGVASAPLHADRSRLVQTADAALLRAKQAGRNRVLVAEARVDRLVA